MFEARQNPRGKNRLFRCYIRAQARLLILVGGCQRFHTFMTTSMRSREMPASVRFFFAAG